MKKRIILFSSIMCLAVMTAINAQLIINQDSCFSLEQIEALASGETLPGVDVTCGKHNCGRCFEIIPTNTIPYCKWTGYQDDYCPWEN